MLLLAALIKLFFPSVCFSLILVGYCSNTRVSAILALLLYHDISAFFFKPYISAALRFFLAIILPFLTFFISLCYHLSHRRKAALFLALSLILSSIGMTVILTASEERLIGVFALFLVMVKRARVILRLICFLAYHSGSRNVSVA